MSAVGDARKRQRERAQAGAVDGLSEAERADLLRAWPWPKEAATTADGFGDVVIAVTQIVAARLAAVRAEALRDAAKEADAGDDAEWATDFPAWLRDRADRIEGGDA